MTEFMKMADMTREILVASEKTLQREHELHFAERCLSIMESLERVRECNGLTQLEHGLQTATRALRDNASDEMVFVALLHDFGKGISQCNHGAIAAEILKPFVSEEAYRAVLHHEAFQGYYYLEHFGLDKNIRERFKQEPWYSAAVKLHEWDSLAFDLRYESRPLAEFRDLVIRFLGKYPYEVRS